MSGLGLAASRGSIRRAVSRATCPWIEQRIKPGDGARVEIPAPAHITNPGWKIWDRDQFLVQPGEISHRFHAHHASQTFRAMIC